MAFRLRRCIRSCGVIPHYMHRARIVSTCHICWVNLCFCDSGGGLCVLCSNSVYKCSKLWYWSIIQWPRKFVWFCGDAFPGFAWVNAFTILPLLYTILSGLWGFRVCSHSVSYIEGCRGFEYRAGTKFLQGSKKLWWWLLLKASAVLSNGCSRTNKD